MERQTAVKYEAVQSILIKMKLNLIHNTLSLENFSFEKVNSPQKAARKTILPWLRSDFHIGRLEGELFLSYRLSGL